ncbi:MAG: OmpA family protein, partial [Pseudomonadota bacterium]
TAGSIVDAARVIDELDVQAQAELAPPRFSAEVLRNDSGVSIIGLVPVSTDRDAIVERFGDIAGDVNVTDLLEEADYPAPPMWEDALAFAMSAMAQLPRAKASIEAGRVTITAIAESAAEKAQMERKLDRSTPPSLEVSLFIAAPRPVITPFTLRFEMDEDGARFDACSADTESARNRILTAARAAGMPGAPRCTIGLGVPSPTWAEAAVQAIDAVARLGGGSVTIADADMTLVGIAGSDEALFDRVAGELQTSLPEVFVLQAKLPKLPDPNEGPPEFTATLSPEGQLQMRGRVSDAAMRTLADSYAQARFGTGRVYTATRITEDLPANWGPRVLTALEALAALENGSVLVTPDRVGVSGSTGNPDASNEIASLLSSRLGDGAVYDIDVTYLEKLDPVLGLPTPDECEEQIGTILARGKITFEPNSATIDASALTVMDDIAEVLENCGDLRLEIQGYTDSQGRESMNLALSQSRAESVLNELRARRVLTSSFKAVGYGEENPVADNSTEEGREANRRIEFKLVRSEETPVEVENPSESAAPSSDPEGPTSQESTTDEQN